MHSVSEIMAAWRHGSVEVLLSTYILAELRRVLPRLANRHGLTLAEIDDLVDVLSIQAELIEPLPRLRHRALTISLPVIKTCWRWLNTTQS